MFGEPEYDPTLQFFSIGIEEQLGALGRAVVDGKVSLILWLVPLHLPFQYMAFPSKEGNFVCRSDMLVSATKHHMVSWSLFRQLKVIHAFQKSYLCRFYYAFQFRTWGFFPPFYLSLEFGTWADAAYFLCNRTHITCFAELLILEWLNVVITRGIWWF